MNCPLSFAMWRDYFQTKRSFSATNRSVELVLNKLGTRVVSCRRGTRMRCQCARRATATTRRLGEPVRPTRAATRTPANGLRVYTERAATLSAKEISS
jgi:hypothetical protein